MKPREKKPDIVYRIYDRQTGSIEGCYSRACCNEYDFNSLEEARGANCHGIYDNESKYKISKYRVIYELVEDDVQEDSEVKQKRIDWFKTPQNYYGEW